MYDQWMADTSVCANQALGDHPPPSVVRRRISVRGRHDREPESTAGCEESDATRRRTHGAGGVQQGVQVRRPGAAAAVPHEPALLIVAHVAAHYRAAHAGVVPRPADDHPNCLPGRSTRRSTASFGSYCELLCCRLQFQKVHNGVAECTASMGTQQIPIVKVLGRPYYRLLC